MFIVVLTLACVMQQKTTNLKKKTTNQWTADLLGTIMKKDHDVQSQNYAVIIRDSKKKSNTQF